MTTAVRRVLVATLAGLAAACLACVVARSDVRPDAPLVIHDVSVVDVDAGRVVPAQDVVVRGGRIASVGPTAAAVVPGAHVVEGRGAFLVPGLWDMHAHPHRAGRAVTHYPLHVAHGVVGIRAPGAPLDSILAWRRAWRADDLVPRVWWGSPIVDGDPPVLDWSPVARDSASAVALVARLDSLGFDFVKVYDRLPRDAYFALAAEARRRGLAVEGHVPLRVIPVEAVDAGQRVVEHVTLVLESCLPGALDRAAAGWRSESMLLLADTLLAASLDTYDAIACDRLFARFRQAGTWHVPTLVQGRGWFRDDSTPDPRDRLIPRAMLAEWRRYPATLPARRRAAGRRVVRRQLELVGAMHRRGVRVLAGTDASDEPWVYPGASLHDELALLVEAGLSPLDALRAATIEPARYLGAADSLGLVAPGHAADLVLLDANPLDDVRNTTRIRAVVLRGRLLDRQTLDGMLDDVRRRAAGGP